LAASIESMVERYEIRVGGRLSSAVAATFDVAEVRVDGRNTLLVGSLADQAALYGVLDRVQALGLELIEVRRVPPAEVSATRGA
jgi:hypothetical protein